MILTLIKLLKMIRYSFFLSLLLSCLQVAAQAIGKTDEPTPIYTPKELPLIRSADVMWHRRLWREIDLTEKTNQHLYFYKNNPKPNLCLFDLIYQHVLNGSLKAYSTKDDKFTTELNVDSLPILLADSIYISDTTENKIKQFVPVVSKDVVKFWLKEDWIYDSKYSRIDVRIIGICPVRIKKDEFGQVIGYQQLFWVYFPHARNILVNHEAFKKESEDAPRISFDDVFLERKFSSIIINENDKKDLHLKENLNELDTKLETERSKIYHYEPSLNLWK